MKERTDGVIEDGWHYQQEAASEDWQPTDHDQWCPMVR